MSCTLTTNGQNYCRLSLVALSMEMRVAKFLYACPEYHNQLGEVLWGKAVIGAAHLT